MEVSKTRLIDAAWDADIDMDSGLRWDYSGRGMYGRTCFGIIGRLENYAQFLLSLAAVDAEGAEIASALAERTATDNMAVDTIYYFPRVEVTED